MNWKRALIGILVVALLLAGGALVYRQFYAPAAGVTAEATEAPPETTAASPDRDTIAVDTGVASVSAEGQIVPLRSATLAFAAPGTVAVILVAEGDRVDAGQPLLRLDSSDQELGLRRAEAGLAQAEANLAAARARQTVAGVSVEAAELGVEAAAIDVALAEAEPRPEALAVGESNVALAEARVRQAMAARALVLDAVSDAQVRAAEAELRAAEAQTIAPRLRLEQLRQEAEPDVDALAQAEQEYAATLAAVEAAQVALSELEQGATAAQQQAAGSRVTAATAQRDAAQAELALLQAGGRAEQVAAAEAGLLRAQAAMAEAQAALQEAEATLAQAEAEVNGARALVALAQEALADRLLTAPFAATVADLQVDVGEGVGAGLPVAILADFSGWLVETTDLTELDVVAVAAGYPAEVRIDALPDETLSGVVTGITAIAEEVRGDITFKVTIALDDPSAAPLRWGMTVFTTIATSGS